MAVKKPAAQKEAAKPEAKKGKAAPAVKAEDAKAAKRKERLEKAKENAKNRPAGQRPNSKTFDVIELANGSKVLNYAQNVRKFGVVITSVAIDADGNVTSTSVTTLPNFRVKSKKEHGNLVPGIPGVKKGSDEEEGEDEE